MINVEKFYNLSRIRHSNAVEAIAPGMRFVKSLVTRCLNDNDVIRIIYDLAGQSGKIPNDLDFSISPNVPAEVSNLIAQIQRERPLQPYFKDDETAFEFVRSRYCQFAGELDEYADYLKTIMEDAISRMPNKSSDEPNIEPNPE